jgi:hypothetical protein
MNDCLQEPRGKAGTDKLNDDVTRHPRLGKVAAQGNAMLMPGLR